MASVKTISAALKLIDVKKEKLKLAFEDLQARSSSLSSFSLTWSDLDSYFTSFQSSLEQKFNLLQTLEPQSQAQVQTLANSIPSSNQHQQEQKQKQTLSKSLITKNPSVSVPVSARPELKSLCEKMDGLGLRKYLMERPKDRAAIWAELADAWKHAPDAAAMVLDAMEGFYAPNLRIEELRTMRRSCVGLMEELMRTKVEIGAEVKERAKRLAVEWKGKMTVDEDELLEVLGFLQLLATYGLVDGFHEDEIIEYLTIVARNRQAVELCRTLAPGDKVPDLIRKLISKGKQLLAVKFIFEFALTDKFLPVPLLKGYVMDAKKLAQKVRKDGKHSRQSVNEAIAKEVSALKSVIKHIEDRNLESEYSKEILVKRIEKLEKEKMDKKRPAASAAPKPHQQSRSQNQDRSKLPRTDALDSPARMPMSVAAFSSVPAIQQSHPQMAGLGSYAGSSVGIYGFSGAPLGGFPGNLAPTGSNQYPSQSQIPSDYYDGSSAYGAYGLPPQYHPSYYPQ